MSDDIPVGVGIVYEGERIRGPDVWAELGGPKVEYKAELAQFRKEIEDGKVVVIGKDIPELGEGGQYPFGILLEFYGKGIEKDIEPVIERRIHDFLNYVEGFMHLNQRYDIWCRVSKKSKDAGLRFKHLGKALMQLYKAEYNFLEKIQITFMTDETKVKEHYEWALKIYNERDQRVRGMKDSDVDVFYSCILCQSFAPNHVCIISPQRPSLCGAISWLDARAASRVDPGGPISEFEKGSVLDETRGEYSGVNKTVKEKSNGTNDRIYMYGMFEKPHTSCGCFEAIAFYIPEVDGIGIVDRHFKDDAVNGLKFSNMASQTGGGEQTEGFLGFGLEWMHSQKFLAGEGGWNRIVWMPSQLKERMKAAIPKNIFDKIPTEKNTNNVNDLEKILREKGHPVLSKKKFEVTKELKDKLFDYIKEKNCEIFPDEAARHFGIDEEQLMQVIEALKKDGVLE